MENDIFATLLSEEVSPSETHDSVSPVLVSGSVSIFNQSQTSVETVSIFSTGNNAQTE